MDDVNRVMEEILGEVVTKFQGLATWGVLFKNETWLLQGSFIYLQQVKETGFSFKALSPGREA